MVKTTIYFKQLARCHHLSQEGGKGPVGWYNFPAYDNSLAAPSHVYHTTAQTDPTGIEPGPHNCNTYVLHQPTIGTHDLAILLTYQKPTYTQTITQPISLWLLLLCYWLLKCLFSKGESSFVPMALCPVGIGSLTLRTDTLFTPASKEDRSFYLSIYQYIILHSHFHYCLI